MYDREIHDHLVRITAGSLAVYFQLPKALQDNVRVMVDIYRSPDSDEQEKAMALHTIDDIIWSSEKGK